MNMVDMTVDVFTCHMKGVMLYAIKYEESCNGKIKFSE
jgi:hypothetical protein